MPAVMSRQPHLTRGNLGRPAAEHTTENTGQFYFARSRSQSTAVCTVRDTVKSQGLQRSSQRVAERTTGSRMVHNKQHSTAQKHTARKPDK